MSRTSDRPDSALRHVFLTLAAFAVALKVLVPAGFMVRAAANDLPFAIVLCTDQGAVTVAPGQALPGGHDKDSGASAEHQPCAFAGHGASAPAPEGLESGIAELAAYQGVLRLPRAGVSPGRGLAAPPPPATGPPALLI